MNTPLPGSQSIPPVVGPGAHEMYPGMHAPGDHAMGHVAAGMIFVISLSLFPGISDEFTQYTFQFKL